MDGAAIVDEFAGCTLEDIAMAIAYGEPGSDDQTYAIDALRRRLPAPPGHNQPPLQELLNEELEPFRRRRDELVRVAETSRIVDEETAGKVLDLSQQCRAFEAEIDERRKGLVKPHRDAERLINDSHNRLKLDVQRARHGSTGSGGLRGLLTAWDDAQKAKAKAVKEQAEREAKAKEEAAEAARQKLVEIAPDGRGAVSAELAAMAARDQADQAREKVETIQAAPIRGHLGQVNRKREIRFEIGEPMRYAAWLYEQPGLSNQLLASLFVICNQHLRSLGVDAIEAGIQIPGVAVGITQGDAIIRR